MTSAVTDGVPDGDGHPYVGLMVAQTADGTPLWRCSGTLIRRGPVPHRRSLHRGPADHVEIWFDADVESGIPGNDYPYTGDVGGTPYTHPDYNPNAFYLYDLGVVVLDDPVSKGGLGELPTLNELDKYKTQRGIFEGPLRLRRVRPADELPGCSLVEGAQPEVRMTAHPRLIQINGGMVGRQSLLLSNNANTGGTCFGDSGGPNFLAGTNTIAGVTSFGQNGNCAGTGGVYRVDRADDLDWLATF